MSSNVPPIYSFSGINFNPAYFSSIGSYITLNYANSNYLKRVGVATSVATTTTFSGSLSTQLNSTFNSVNIGKGTGSNTTIVGNAATAINNYCTSIGGNSNSAGSTIIGCATALGFQSNAVGDGALAVGYNAVATINAVALGSNSIAGDNQIVLGTATNTVICKGTASGISLTATNNLSVNGAVFGTGSAGTNSLFSGLLVGTGIGANNTLYGKGSYSSALDGSSSGNTIIGAGSSNPVYGIMSNHTVIGYNAGGISPSSAQNNITCLGSGSNVIGGVSQSTAIGYGTQSTLANQIVLGTATETVYCVGVPTTGSTPYTSLVLSSGIQLQTAYPAVPSSTMLGYRLSNSASPFSIGTSLIISGSVVNFAPVGGIVLSSGTWSINFTLELLVATAITTATAQTIYVSTASAGAYSTRVPACGSTRIHTTYTYAIGDTPAFSGSFFYYTALGASLYPVFILTFSGGAFSGTGYYTATRIG